MDKFTKLIQEKFPWCMFFASDIVLMDESHETGSGLNAKLKIWRDNLELKGFQVTRIKTKHMECKFSKSIKGL